VLTYWSFSDALIQTYTIPYLRIIKQLDPENISITLLSQEKIHADVQRVKNITDPDFSVEPLPYYPFGAKAFLKWAGNLKSLRKLIAEKNINVIHCWCTPAGMIGYLLHKRTGIKLIADSFEPHAEAMVENGTWKKNSLAFKILFRYEKLLARHASEVIAIAPGMDIYSREKYNAGLKNTYIKPACTDLEKFSLKNRKDPALLKELGLENKIVAVYAGKFGGIYLDKEVFSFFKEAYSFWKDKLKILLLTNETDEKLNTWMKQENLPSSLFIKKFVPHSEIPNYMGLADFALCPVKPVPTKKFCSPVKTGEYWALGLPVIIPRNISNDSELIETNKLGYVWKEISAEEFRNSVKAIDRQLRENSLEELYKKIRPLAEQYRNFSIAEKIYRKIYFR
jgi:glycosyltransferase involved in cell wall biosynthesis